MKLHPDVERLYGALRRLEYFLRSHAQHHWATTISLCADEVGKSDAHGVARFLQLFGGMGSLNDIACADQKEFDGLTEEAYELAHQLKNEAL